MKYRFALAYIVSALAMGVGPASAAVNLDIGSPKCMNAGGCFNGAGVQTQMMSTAGSGIWQGGSITLNKAMIGDANITKVFHITFWTADGSQKVGDFGNFMIAGLNGDSVTLAGPQFEFNGDWGDMMVKFEVKNFGRDYASNGSDGFRASLPNESGGAGGVGGAGGAGGAGGGGAGGSGGAGGASGSGGAGGSGGAFGGSGEGGDGGFGGAGGFGGDGAAGGAGGDGGFGGGGDGFDQGTPGSDGPFNFGLQGLDDGGQGGAGDLARVSAAPEPGAWALMIAGFGLSGAALRRRRQAAHTA